MFLTASTFTSITIPVYNEEELLENVVRELVDALEGLGVVFELILVENGSTDSSTEIVDELARQDERIHTIHLPLPDYGQAVRQGYLAGTGDYLANFSVDWVDAGFLQAALSKLSQFDIVLASKGVIGSSYRGPLIRSLGTYLFHTIVRALFNLPITDTHGIKVLRQDKTRGLVEKCRFGGEVFDTELIVRAYRAGLSMFEMPIQLEEKRPSREGVFKRAWRGLVQLVKLRIVLWCESVPW